jgi:hypothetical protein
LNRKTLAAQASIAKEQGSRLANAQIASGQAGEATRAQIQSGLGSAKQLSGGYSGATPRDLSKYSQGLVMEGGGVGGNADVLANLSQARGAETVLKPQRIDPRTGKVTKQAVTLGDVAGRGPSGYDNMLGEYSNKRTRQAVDEVRRAELFGQVTEVNALYQQAYDAAKSGDYTAADALQKQADDMAAGFGLNENFSSQGLRSGAGGAITFSKGQKFDPLFDTEAAAGAALASPGAMLVGGVVSKAREMMDPNSAEAMRFKDSLTSGALTAVEQGRQQAVRALGAQERTGARQQRDMMMGTGAAGQTAKMAAVGARNAERFATMRADVEGGAAAQRAQIHGDASKMYESFRYDLANNATSLAAAWVNNESGVRDNFRQTQNSLVSQYVSDVFGLASSVTGSLAQMSAAREAAKAGTPSTGDQIISGVTGLVSAYLGAS